jgi:D-threo-aldose 1-dehydrogenase
VRAAWADGVRYIDTAPFYGFGRAERCVGDAMRDIPRDDWVLSTKVGRLLRPRLASMQPDNRPMPFDPVYNYSYDGIMRSFEDSLQRLGLTRIDILFVHDIGARTHGREAHPGLMRTLQESGYRALDSLRSAGVIKAIGIGVNEREVLLEALEWGAWDVFLLAGRYTLLEQEPLDDLLPKCGPAGVSIIVGAPLNSGILAGRETWNYAAAPPGRRRSGRRAPSGLRQPSRPACRGGIAIPARPSSSRSNYPRAPQCRRICGQSGITASSDSGGAVGRFAPSRAPSP